MNLNPTWWLSLYALAVLHDGRKWCGRNGHPCHRLSQESGLSVLLFRNRYLVLFWNTLLLFLLTFKTNLFVNEFINFEDFYLTGENSAHEDLGTLSNHNRAYECSMVSTFAMETARPALHDSCSSLSSSYTCTTFKPPPPSQTPSSESPAS